MTPEINPSDFGQQMGELIGTVNHIETRQNELMGHINDINRKLDEHIAKTSSIISFTPKTIIVAALIFAGALGIISIGNVSELVKIVGIRQQIYAQWANPREEQRGMWGVDGGSIYK